MDAVTSVDLCELESRFVTLYRKRSACLHRLVGGTADHAVQQAAHPRGVVLAVEPAFYLPGWGGIRLEHVFAVRGDGNEILTKFEHAL